MCLNRNDFVIVISHTYRGEECSRETTSVNQSDFRFRDGCDDNRISDGRVNFCSRFFYRHRTRIEKRSDEFKRLPYQLFNTHIIIG
jgi:hypothetical protein